MRTTPGVALREGKPRRKYSSLLHLTRWTDHLEPKRYFTLALYRTITLSAVLLKSQRLRGIFLWRDSCPFSHRFELCSRVNNIQDTSRLSPLSRTWECPKSLYWMFRTSYMMGHCLDSKDRAGKWEKARKEKAQRLLVLDFVHRMSSVRFVNLCKCSGW